MPDAYTGGIMARGVANLSEFVTQGGTLVAMDRASELPLTTFGLDGLHPYLRLARPPRTLAHRLGDAGFLTMFAHPFDMDFFNRSEAHSR